jgi:glycosyltransferase involved in cell wall biosynthesis
MRLIYFTQADSPHDQRFLRALAGTQHQVFALRQEQSQANTPAGITALTWPDGQPDWRHWEGWQYGLDQFHKILTTIQPDLVHAGPIQGPALLVALSGFQPLVTMSWGSDILAHAKRSPWMRYVTKYVLDRTRLFLGDCDAVIEEAKKYDFPLERVVSFPWGVDLDHFSPGNGKNSGRDLRVSLGWGDKFIILCNRSWYPIYGVDLMAKAFASAALENDQLRLLLAGDGPQSGLIHNLLAPVDDRVHYLGWVDPGQLPGVYCAADLFVSPSHCDGSSVSLLEAMACGRPVLVSDIPSNKEWVKPGETGMLFEDVNLCSLKGRILQMSRDPDLALFGCCARALAEERADWNKNFQKLLAAYQRAL